MKNKQVIVYLGAFRFPNKDAAAKRVLGMGYILRDLGYKVVYAGGETGDKFVKKHEDFEYYSQNELDTPALRGFDKLKKFLTTGNNTVEWLNHFIKDQKIEKIIIYNSSGIFINKIKKFCKKNDIELIADITEWYSSSHLPGGNFGPLGLDNLFKMNYIYRTVPKQIVISSYIEKFYKQNVSVIIPPLVLGNWEGINNINDRKKIIYVGSPGKKDNLELMVESYLSQLDKFFNIDLYIAGITEKEYTELYKKELLIQNKIIFLGKINKEEVEELYRGASFSFFFRPNERYANAGFPTKFVESLSYGVPLICNSTSDIKNYLENGKNGFLVEDLTLFSIKKVLENVNNLSTSEIINMKKNALVTSEIFCYKKFIDTMRAFLN